MQDKTNVKTGQSVVIKLNKYGNQEVNGQITSIKKLGKYFIVNTSLIHTGTINLLNGDVGTAEILIVNDNISSKIRTAFFNIKL